MFTPYVPVTTEKLGKCMERIFCRSKEKASPHISFPYSDTNQELASSRQFTSVDSARQYR